MGLEIRTHSSTINTHNGRTKEFLDYHYCVCLPKHPTWMNSLCKIIISCWFYYPKFNSLPILFDLNLCSFTHTPRFDVFFSHSHAIQIHTAIKGDIGKCSNRLGTRCFILVSFMPYSIASSSVISLGNVYFVFRWDTLK